MRVPLAEVIQRILGIISVPEDGCLSPESLRRFDVCCRESPRLARIDASQDSFYIRLVPVRKIQVGQVWKKDEGGDTFLVTKVYNEALATFAVLRKAGSESEPPVRVKVARNGVSPTLPGFTYAQESDEF